MGRLLRAYGFCVAAPGLDLPGMHDARGVHPDLVVTLGEPATLFSGPCDPERVARRRAGGTDARYERGRDGDVLITWDGGGAFRISPGGREIVAGGAPGRAWQRFLLDSVLVTAALAAGREALHAGAVAFEDGAVVVAAGQGGGKTTLVAELLRAGGALVADDVCVLLEGSLIAPAPPVLSLAGGGPVPPEDVGAELAGLDGEHWLVAGRHAEEPARVAAVILLDRRPGASLELERLGPSPLPLLPLLLDSGPERQRARFAAVSDLADAAPLVRLHAPPDASPATLRGVLGPYTSATRGRSTPYFSG